jgi:hypothetical protein
MAISIEFQTVEDSYHTDVLHLSILHNGIKDNLAVSIHILQFMPCNMLQER